MSKKHFQALADALKMWEPIKKDNPEAYNQWQLDCAAIAGVCINYNPRFDRARFLAACGMETK